jgi:hypothetical protein
LKNILQFFLAILLSEAREAGTCEVVEGFGITTVQRYEVMGAAHIVRQNK